jgi:hypothetical protein
LDTRLEAKRRMLMLLEDTEQQLAGQGQGGLDERRPEHSSVEAGTEVSRKYTAGASAVLAYDTCVHAVTAPVVNCSQAVLPIFA